MMFAAKKLTAVFVIAGLAMGSAYARDTTLNLPFNDAVAKAK